MHMNKPVTTEQPIRKAFLVGVEVSGQRSIWTVDDSLAELGQLAQTAGIEVVGRASQKVEKPSPSHYLGRGKVEQIRDLKAELGYDLVIFDDELSPIQHRNLERDLAARILDRSGLILDVFGQRARTREGQLQVELAQYEYLLPRLTRQWTHLSRQFGAIGARGGPGETQLEVDRRRVRERITELKREIEKVRRHRALYREQRQHEGIPVVALVGYTNAGKSTLLNALTNAGVAAEDQLFDTLDPTTRRIKLPSGRAVLLSDTVGFIQKLPPSVVVAFRATLEELAQADVMVHIVDITHDCGYEQSRTVDDTLRELGLDAKPVVTALNKIDRLVDEAKRRHVKPNGNLRASLGDAWEPLKELASHYPNGVPISAALGWGLEALRDRIESVLKSDLVDITVRLPYSAGDLVALFHAKASVTKRSYTKDGVLIKGKVAQQLVPLFRKYAV
ncbi:MAG: GTPase HflX [Chloroflexi bacterium]|nr:GTPase HflX [Chloroflexota bacterium]